MRRVADKPVSLNQLCDGMFVRVVSVLVFLVVYSSHPRSTPWAAPLYVPAPRLTTDSIVAYEARRAGVPVSIALAVSRAENYSGDSTAVSSVGAVGILQIHPVNFGRFEEECGPSITNRHTNACYGMLLLRRYYQETQSWGAALRRYLGFRKNVKAWMDYTDDIIDNLVGVDE